MLKEQYDVIMEDYGKNKIGIGFYFIDKDGKKKRTAVIVRSPITCEKLRKTFEHLYRVVENPKESDCVVEGNVMLRGCEVEYEDIR